MIGAIYRNEMLKMAKRLAFVVTLIVGLFMQVMMSGGQYYSSNKNPDGPQFTLPGSWSDILSMSAQMTFFFGSVALMLLITSEFSWRTARQSVIDGLTKSQFFAGKLSLVPTLGIIFLSSQIIVGASFALLGTDFANLSGPLIGSVHLAMIAGSLLGFLGYASIAFFVSMSARSSGAAIGIWFFWVVLAEEILGSVMRGLGEKVGDAARYLPVNVFSQLGGYRQYDPDAFAAAVARATEAGFPPPAPPWDWPVLLAWFTLWTGLLLGGAFIWFRKRDL